MITLSDRLQVIANYIEPGESVADIGTDHGYLPVYLYQNNISHHIVMADINHGPIERAKENANKYLGDNDIEVRIGSGLAVLAEKEVDTIVIAGMGGLLIKDILEIDIQKAKSCKKLILQPRNAQDKLREWLINNGFYIEDEALVREGKFICEVLKVIKGKDHVSDSIYYEIGQRLVEKKAPLLVEFLDRKIAIEKKIISSIWEGRSFTADSQLNNSTKRIEKLEEVKKYVCGNQ